MRRKDREVKDLNTIRQIITYFIASFGSVEHLFRYLWNIFFGITEHLIQINRMYV